MAEFSTYAPAFHAPTVSMRFMLVAKSRIPRSAVARSTKVKNLPSADKLIRLSPKPLFLFPTPGGHDVALQICPNLLPRFERPLAPVAIRRLRVFGSVCSVQAHEIIPPAVNDPAQSRLDFSL